LTADNAVFLPCDRVLYGPGGLCLKFTNFNWPGRVRAKMSLDRVGPDLKVPARPGPYGPGPEIHKF